MSTAFQPPPDFTPASSPSPALPTAVVAGAAGAPSTAVASAPVGSPPILCEYLSPHVLKKEVIHLLEVKPARFFCTKDFRKNSAVLFWNLMWSVKAATRRARRGRPELSQHTDTLAALLPNGLLTCVCVFDLICFVCRHFTNQCLPVDFLIRREPKSAQARSGMHTPLSSHAQQRSSSTAAKDAEASAARRRKRRQDSISAAPAAPAPMDDFERAIAVARASGVGRSFGYGTGGMVSGTGAVGISLGDLMRTRGAGTGVTIQPASASAQHSASQSINEAIMLEEEEFDDGESDEYDEEDEEEQQQQQQPEREPQDSVVIDRPPFQAPSALSPLHEEVPEGASPASMSHAASSNADASAASADQQQPPVATTPTTSQSASQASQSQRHLQ